MYAIREDNSETARWLVEFEVKGICLTQFDDIGAGGGLVAFESAEAARRVIAGDPGMSSAVITEFEVVDGCVTIVVTLP